MTQLDIYYNYNGKFFCDFFSHIMLYTSEFQEDEEVEIVHRGINIGKVKVVRMMSFPFSALRDSVSFLNMGKSAQYQAAALNKKYNNGNTMDRSEMITHVILGWTERNFEAQNDLIKSWWQQKQLNTAL